MQGNIHPEHLCSWYFDGVHRMDAYKVKQLAQRLVRPAVYLHGVSQAIVLHWYSSHS